MIYGSYAWGFISLNLEAAGTKKREKEGEEWEGREEREKSRDRDKERWKDEPMNISTYCMNHAEEMCSLQEIHGEKNSLWAPAFSIYLECLNPSYMSREFIVKNKSDKIRENKKY